MQILCRKAIDMSSEGEEDEEVRLSQMIRDYIEFGSSNCNPSSYLSSSKKSLVVDHYISLQEILENVTASEAEIMGKILFYLRECLEPEKEQKKWIAMRLGSLDHYQACLCTTSWVTSSRCPSVFKFKDEYEYIEVNIPKNEREAEGEGGGRRLIIDIDFRSQFELARATQTYKQLWNSLPDIFVGTEEKLEKIITLLCSAAKDSLRESGLHIPPWRKTAYMHSKWLSQNCKKISSTDLAPPND